MGINAVGHFRGQTTIMELKLFTDLIDALRKGEKGSDP